MKKWAGIIVAFILLMMAAFPVTAHDNNSHHDRELEYVLFGQKNYKSTHPTIADSIQMLQDASYLCLDQFNGDGEDDLKFLNKKNVPEIPQNISEIDFKGNYSHRKWTHRGWNVNYSEKGNWPMRQKILKNTIQKVFFPEANGILKKIPFAGDLFAGNDNHDQQIEGFAILLYNIHVLGDHLEATKFDALGFVDPLTRANDQDNPGIIPDIKNSLELIFPDQQDTFTYSTLLQQLEALESKSNKLVGSEGGVDTEEKFEEYHQIASDLLDVLSAYIPTLLKREAFFQNVFYS